LAAAEDHQEPRSLLSDAAVIKPLRIRDWPCLPDMSALTATVTPSLGPIAVTSSCTSGEKSLALTANRQSRWRSRFRRRLGERSCYRTYVLTLLLPDRCQLLTLLGLVHKASKSKSCDDSDGDSSIGRTPSNSKASKSSTPFARGLGAWDRVTACSAVGALGGCDDEHSQAERRVGVRLLDPAGRGVGCHCEGPCWARVLLHRTRRNTRRVDRLRPRGHRRPERRRSGHGGADASPVRGWDASVGDAAVGAARRR
jgi:hypothetical protein